MVAIRSIDLLVVSTNPHPHIVVSTNVLLWKTQDSGVVTLASFICLLQNAPYILCSLLCWFWNQGYTSRWESSQPMGTQRLCGSAQTFGVFVQWCKGCRKLVFLTQTRFQAYLCYACLDNFGYLPWAEWSLVVLVNFSRFRDIFRSHVTYEGCSMNLFCHLFVGRMRWHIFVGRLFRNLDCIFHLKSTSMVLQGGLHGVLSCSLTRLTSRVQKVLHL